MIEIKYAKQSLCCNVLLDYILLLMGAVGNGIGCTEAIASRERECDRACEHPLRTTDENMRSAERQVM